MMNRRCLRPGRAAALAVVFFSAIVGGQTPITPPNNSYTPAQDVELGRKAAAQERQRLPVMEDDAVTSYLESVGHRLVAAIPPELQHAEFQYTFEVINVRDLNAFALPGGPMFVNRGIVEAARTEGEVAGVMAHELSHVALRHGTAQASKAAKLGVGQVAGALLGAIIGGGVGKVVSEGTQVGLGATFLRFSRDDEKQADIEGSHIMARAGYDPGEMANMFKTIENQATASGPQWMSDHPNPGNRSDYIAREAELLRVENPVTDARGFDQAQAHLKSLPPAPTTAEATRQNSRGASTPTRGSRGPAPRIDAPSPTFRTFTEGNAYRVSVPSNWLEVQEANLITFAPDGAYSQSRGQSVITHGIQFGVMSTTKELRAATNDLLDSLARGNPNLSRPSEYDPMTIDNRRGMRTLQSNRSEATGGVENIAVFTAQFRDGRLFYAVAVAPRDAFASYSDVFDRIVSSIQFIE